MDAILKSENIAVERKNFIFDLRENPRGRFLRITETAHGHRNAVIIPSTGLADFTSALAAVLNLANKASSATPAASA